MNVVVTDSRHDRVKLNYISHQTDHGEGRVTGISISYLNPDGGGETDFRDKPATVNDKSSKIHSKC